MSVFVMPDYETYDPPERDKIDSDNPDGSIRYSKTDYQISWGYAWRLKNQRKIMVNLNVATAVPIPHYFIPSIGVYYQETADSLPYARGVGAIILPDPMVYWLFERDLGSTNRGGRIAELEFAAGFGLYPSFFLHLKLLKQLGPLHAGFISEYRLFWPYTGSSFGDEGYLNDYVKSQLFLGIILIPEFQ